ncbi:hypothetical protein BaRGS_00011855 [Batillaria attramentaria]|uniref:Major facilitator superfamily domain-containing protein 12 n=1 Tax=Batillaria attramentaria TaxID=370345 RepID=A0ABD0LBZ0_9CAEN
MPSATGRLPLGRRLAYSVGHIQNDLHAAMWFSYLLVYMHEVRSFNNIYAGSLLLVGQIADAIATPLIGFESDAANGCLGYTKRKSWHLFGILCTAVSFPFIFSPVYGGHTSDFGVFVYYAAFVIIFQIGWASVQISHLSLIPELTSDNSEIAGLNGWRYAATGFSNLLTYAIAWVILSSGGANVDPDKLTHADSDHFRYLGFIVTGIGLFFSLIFHFGIPEPRRDQHLQDTSSNTSYGAIRQEDGSITETIERSTVNRSRRRKVCEWLTDFRFYQVALVYMCTRLFVNISQVYLPMYLTETIHLDKVTIANVPLVCYASSFVIATVLKIVDKKLGRILTYLLGAVFAIGAAVYVYFIPSHKIWMVYIAAVIIGAGGALMLVTSLSIVADLIGDTTGSSAFVYGAMSFTDKLANGVAVEIIQIFHPCVNCCPACTPYYRKVQSFGPGGAAVLALLGLFMLKLSLFGRRPSVVEAGCFARDGFVTSVHTVCLFLKEPKLLRNPTATSNGIAPNGHANGPVNNLNGTRVNDDSSRFHSSTAAQVHPDPKSSVNDGTVLVETDNSDDDHEETSPLLTHRKT